MRLNTMERLRNFLDTLIKVLPENQEIPVIYLEHDDYAALSLDRAFNQYMTIRGPVRIETKPKKKIKLYKWAYKNFDGSWLDSVLFLPNEEAMNKMLLFESSQMIRLDHTMIEVDEDA